MDPLIEDGRTLLQAAREIHAERHGAQTFTPGTHLPLEEAGRRSGLDPNRPDPGRTLRGWASSATRRGAGPFGATRATTRDTPSSWRPAPMADAR